MAANIAFTDGIGAATLTNDYPAPADRFSNWVPTPSPFGDSTNTLATGALVMVKYRDDYGASFSLEGIPVKASAGGANQVAIAARLIAWLKQGGTCAVTTNDSLGSTYPTCGLWPGTTPQLTLSDKRNLLYTLSLQLINLAGSPVAMNAVYR